MFVGGVEYVPKGMESKAAEPKDGLPYVLIRSYGAGVHIGYLKEKSYQLAGTVVTLLESRNIYYWDGAAGVSQIAENGVSKPENCKITIPVSQPREIANVIEILPITETAKQNLDKVLPWKK